MSVLNEKKCKYLKSLINMCYKFKNIIESWLSSETIHKVLEKFYNLKYRKKATLDWKSNGIYTSFVNVKNISTIGTIINHYLEIETILENLTLGKIYLDFNCRKRFSREQSIFRNITILELLYSYNI